MSANKFVQLLEESGLLNDATMRELKEQVANSKRATAASVARALVDKGYLTKFQATGMVGEATSTASPVDDDGELTVADDDAERELTFADPADDPRAGGPEEEEVVMLEDASEPEEVEGLTPVEDAGEALTPVGTSTQTIAPTALEPLDEGPSGLESLDGGGPSEPFGDPFAHKVQHPQTSTKARRSKKQDGKQRWDSKLMIGGVTGFLLLCIFFVILAVNLLKTPPLEMFNAAEEFYRQESYPQALDQYQKFLDKYPNDENADEARVRSALCQIRIALSDPQKAYDTAVQALPQVVEEEAFRDFARDELVTILPKIPEGFVRRALQSTDTQSKEDLSRKAALAMTDLVNESAYIPSSKRPPIEPLLRRINEDIELVKREIDQDRALAQAIGEIQQHVEAQETVQANEVYKELLGRFPGLRDNAELIASVKSISQREQALVKVVEDTRTASTEEKKPTTEHRLVLASRSGAGVPRLKGQVVSVLAGGSVHGLDAGSGHVLWRRFVGYESQIQPTPVSNQTNSDILISDSRDQELIRVKADTGALVWRLGVGEPFAAPVVAGDMIFVTTKSGKILQVSSATGESTQQVTAPQQLGVPAGVAQVHPYLLQPGDHSNVYVISTQSLACEEVLYVGHKSATIAVAPLVVQDHVFIAENKSDSSCMLHVFRITPGEGPLLSRPQAPLLLAGNVVVPMQLFGRRPLVVTDRGQINLFNVDFNAEENTVTHAVQANPPSRNQPRLSFPVVEGTTLFLADDNLTKYQLQVTTKTMRQVSVTPSKEAFIAPPTLLGDILIVSRRLPDSTGVTVSALQVDKPTDGNAAWTTHLGVPVGRADVASGKLRIISAAASLFEIDRDVWQRGYSDDPAFTAPLAGNLSFTEQIELPDNQVAFFNTADRKTALIFNPSTTSKLRVVPLDVQGGRVTAIPVAFQGGLLTPCDSGTVLLLDVATGGNRVLPFQPKLGPGETVEWRRPAVLGDEFVVADDRQNVYRVGIKEEPKPFLSPMASAKLDVNITSDLAAVGDTVYGVVANSGGDVVVALNASDLSVIKEHNLQGHVIWGPVQVDDAVLCLSDADGLLCFQNGGEQRWATASGCGGNPAGKPLRTDNDYIFALMNGGVVRISGSSGEQIAKTEIGEPLGTGPVAYGSRLLLCGNDGALHVIPMLQAEG